MHNKKLSWKKAYPDCVLYSTQKQTVKLVVKLGSCSKSCSSTQGNRYLVVTGVSSFKTMPIHSLMCYQCYPKSWGSSLDPAEWQRATRAPGEPGSYRHTEGWVYSLENLMKCLRDTLDLVLSPNYLNSSFSWPRAFSPQLSLKSLILPSPHFNFDNPCSPKCSGRQQLLSIPSGSCSPLGHTCLLGQPSLMNLSGPLQKVCQAVDESSHCSSGGPKGSCTWTQLERTAGLSSFPHSPQEVMCYMMDELERRT